MLSYHTHFMKIALALAARHVGLTAPNPTVACLIVKDNQIIATGITGIGGRPHAETIALHKAGKLASGATAYVTLEPCCHVGETGPCADALIKANVAKVVIPVADPFHKVAGGGIKKLQDAGIEVVTGICEKEAVELNAGFMTVHTKNRPYITLKLATSLDGKIATSTGESKWITGQAARDYAHMLRAKNDAIMVGIGTVLADDPLLTCRLSGLEQQSPVRIIMDSELRISKDSKLVKTAKEFPLWVITTADNASSAGLEPRGVKVIYSENGDNLRANLAQVLETLAKNGITRLLVEGGSKLATSFVQQNLVDELVWIKAPVIIGNEGIPAISGLGISALADAKNWVRYSMKALGPDTIEVYRIKNQ